MQNLSSFFGLRCVGCELPIEVENVPVNLGNFFIVNEEAKFVDMFQRPPIKILAPNENLFSVHDEIFRMLYSSGNCAEINESGFDAAMVSEAVDAFRVRFVHPGIDDKSDLHSAICCFVNRSENAFQ